MSDIQDNKPESETNSEINSSSRQWEEPEAADVTWFTFTWNVNLSQMWSQMWSQQESPWS